MDRKNKPDLPDCYRKLCVTSQNKKNVFEGFPYDMRLVGYDTNLWVKMIRLKKKISKNGIN